MDRIGTGIVDGCNDLTRRWVANGPGAGDGGFCLAGPGVWVLLAALQSCAARDVELELALATGVATPDAAPAATALLTELHRDPSVSLVAGLWVGQGIHVHDHVRDQVPGIGIGPLTTTKALDKWARTHTRGMIRSLGVRSVDGIALLLASALVADARWLSAFQPRRITWLGVSPVDALTHTFDDLSAAAVIDDRISRVVVPTDGRFDVHLIAGAPADIAADVLSAAIRAVRNPDRAIPVIRAREAAGIGCFVVENRRTTATGDVAAVDTLAFDIVARHDLLASPDDFGLATAAACPSSEHFPRLASGPLQVNRAIQDARATFSEEGFRAAAVTSIQWMRSALMPHEHVVRALVARHDRPYGYLVVDRDSGLVLFAGWVAEPSA